MAGSLSVAAKESQPGKRQYSLPFPISKSGCVRIFFFQLFVVRFSVPSFTYVHWKNLTCAHCVVVPPHKNGIFSDLVPDLAEHLSVGLKLARQEQKHI